MNDVNFQQTFQREAFLYASKELKRSKVVFSPGHSLGRSRHRRLVLSVFGASHFGAFDASIQTPKLIGWLLTCWCVCVDHDCWDHSIDAVRSLWRRWQIWIERRLLSTGQTCRHRYRYVDPAPLEAGSNDHRFRQCLARIRQCFVIISLHKLVTRRKGLIICTARNRYRPRLCGAESISLPVCPVPAWAIAAEFAAVARPAEDINRLLRHNSQQRGGRMQI